MTNNVINVNFGGKKPGSQADREEPESNLDERYEELELKGESLARARLDLIYMLGNQEFVGQMRDRLVAAGDFVASLKGYTIDDRAVDLRRRGLKADSMEEICQKIAAANESHWRQHPTYVGALTLEYHDRSQKAFSLMPEDED